MLKNPWRYAKIDLFALYGGLNRCGMQTYVAWCKRTTQRHRMNFMGIIATEYPVVDTWVASYGHSLGIVHRYHT